MYEYGSVIYENRSIMGYEILASDFSDFLLSVEDIDSSAVGEKGLPIKLTTPKGDIRYNVQTLNEDLSIQESHYYMQDDVTINGKGDAGLLEIQINLSDMAISFHDKSKAAHITPARSGNIAFLAAEDNQASILFQKDISYTTFDIHLPVSLLDRYAGESRLLDGFLTQIHNNISGLLTPNKININPAIYNTIQDIKTCIYEGLTRKIYLESKAFELIALLYEEAENQKEHCTLHPVDQEKIHWAAAIIRDNLENPLTIMELARLVGVNQTKLKAGFKMIFGHTVFGYLQDIRMHQAKRYLLDTQLSIQEIGMRLGYQNTSNFSMAFKNIHGIPPTKIRQKQAY